MSFILWNPVKVLDHIHMTRIGFGENPTEDAILLSLKDLNNPGTGAASYQFTPKNIARRINTKAHKTFNKRTIDMVLEDNSIKPITITDRTSDTVFEVATNAIAAKLKPGLSIHFTPSDGWPVRTGTIQSVTTNAITLIAPGIAGFTTGDVFLPGSFAKATGADRAAGGFENPLGEYTNHVQMDVRTVSFDMDELNQDELYKPETKDVVLNKFDDASRAAKFGALESFYAGKKSSFNDPDGKPNWTAGGYFSFLTGDNTHYITAGTAQARKVALQSVVSRVKRSGMNNMKIIYVCTNKFKDELLNLYNGTSGSVLVQPSSVHKYRGIDVDFQTYSINGFSMELGASSILDKMFGDTAVAVPVCINHTSIYSLPYIRVNDKLSFDDRFNQGQIWEAPVQGAAIDVSELYFGYAWSWIFGQVGTDAMQYIYLTSD